VRPQLRPTPDTDDTVTAGTRTPNQAAFIAVDDLCSAGARGSLLSLLDNRTF